MLKKAPNNNSVMFIENMVLIEASNSNDATRVVNNLCLTTMGAQQFLMQAI